MTILRHTSLAVLLAASLAAHAGTADTPPADQDQHHRDDDFGGHGPGGPGPDMPSERGQGLHGLRRLHSLHLSEAQQDKVFAIEHAAAVPRREHEKAIRKAHEALRELGRAERFDEARAAAVSRDLGQAVGAQALDEARLHAQVRAVLTPEQREALRREQPPGPHGFGHDAGGDF